VCRARRVQNQATTTSLEALHAYSLAVKMRSPDGDHTAIPFLKRAAELDPNFAMAYARLGPAYANLNLPEQAKAAMEKAYALRDQTSEREKFYIESHYYDLVTGEFDKAIQTYQLWQQTYPDDLTPYVNLGTLYNALGQHEKNLKAQMQVVHLDPSLSYGYSNLVNAYVCLNQLDKAKDVLAQAEARKAENSTFWEIWYEIAFLSGDPAEIERQLNIAMTQGEDGVLALQADTEAYHGHLGKAQSLRSGLSSRLNLMVT
jgi:tetratricopeptide (TPR) repeat protein